MNIPSPALNAIRTSLKANTLLTKLEILDTTVFNVDFSSEIRFKLKELVILFVRNKVQEQNINFFLKTQSDTLEVLTFDRWRNADLMKTIVFMPRLRKFTLQMSLSESCKLKFVHQNSSVVVLNLEVSEYCEKVEIRSLLTAFPKVESLNIKNRNFNDEIANYIPESLIFLKRLAVSSFRAVNISNEAFYLNLEEINCSYQGVLPSSSKLFEKLNGNYKFVKF